MVAANALMSHPRAEEIALEVDPNQEAVIDRFQRWSATYFLALFSGRLFDQVLLPEVAAGVESTGRIRYTPFARAGRSAASDQLVVWGDAETRQGEFDRLKTLHRDIRGVSSDGVRFSALSPEAWNWILISTMFMYLNSYRAIARENVSDDDLQTLWEHSLQQFDGLQLTGRNRLPHSYADAVAYYDSVITTKGERTAIFAHVMRHLRRPPAPEGTPPLLRPLLRLLGRLPIRVVRILSLGITEPSVRELGGYRWTRRDDAEFALYTRLIGIAHRRLPRRLAYTPLAYNRWRYERIVGKYQRAGLESFAPDGRCPIGR